MRLEYLVFNFKYKLHNSQSLKIIITVLNEYFLALSLNISGVKSREFYTAFLKNFLNTGYKK